MECQVTDLATDGLLTSSKLFEHEQFP